MSEHREAGGRNVWAAALLLALIGLAPALASAADVPPCDEESAAAETRAEVPELIAFHEVIYQIWHDAWPNKNADLLKELLPQVKEHVAILQKVELPGILRDKKVRWDEGIAELVATAGEYETAATGGELQPLLDSAEELHSRFEGLVRVIRPVMSELDAYHQVLYRIYHHDWPQRKLDSLRTHAGELAQACDSLVVAAVPRRFEERAEELKTGFASLCEATVELGEIAKGGDEEAIGKAVEIVHSRYQAAERLFE